MMLSFLRKIIPERSPVRLFYHQLSAMCAAIWYRFPGHYMTVIAVTGTSGKSTTVELIHYLFQSSGEKCGALSTIQFQIGEATFDNASLRTTLRPWALQKWLRRMVKNKCKYAVIETSSHALDQNRLWGVGVDTAVLTNVSDNEHLDYHGDFEDYVSVKMKLFRLLNQEYRKAGIPKTSLLNADSDSFEAFRSIPADRKVSFGLKQGDFQAKEIRLGAQQIEFFLRIPNNKAEIRVPMIGKHNVENVLTALAVASVHKISLETLRKNLLTFPGIPSRMEPVSGGAPFTVLVDYTYKPSALRAVLLTLKDLTKGRIIVVWGGAGGRAESNWRESGQVLDQYADEIVLTTDDPYKVDPKHIARCVREEIKREEGAGFFAIEDRYEAIRYAILTAQKDDIILVAGRGHESIQTIGKHEIEFDDRAVCREILEML